MGPHQSNFIQIFSDLMFSNATSRKWYYRLLDEEERVKTEIMCLLNLHALTGTTKDENTRILSFFFS
jgi:hypothetical protein